MLQWMEKWAWIFDAVLAVPGLRFSDLKWLAKQRGDDLWDNQLTRAISSAAKSGLIAGQGRHGYHALLPGIAYFDLYAQTVRTHSPHSPAGIEATHIRGGRYVGQAAYENAMVFLDGRVHRAMKALEASARSSFTGAAKSNDPGMILRGIRASKTLSESRRTSLLISDSVKNNLTAIKPVDGSWPEHWAIVPGLSSAIPIVTIENPHDLRATLTLASQFEGWRDMLVIVDINGAFDDHLMHPLEALSREIVFLASENDA